MSSLDERRPVPGLQGVLEVDRSCNLYLDGASERLSFNWPEARIEVRGHTLGIHAAEAAALAFLTDDERRALQLDEDLFGAKGPKDRLVRERAAALGLSPWAVWECIRLDKDGFTLPGRVAALSADPADAQSNAVGAKPGVLTTWVEEGDIVDAAFEEYPPPTLHEFSRSPRRGGNTGALHLHRIKVSGQWYTFFAVGAKKWAYIGDRVSFRYRVTQEGYRNIVTDTFRTVDKTGTAVERGNRQRKQQLRTVSQRLPASRRERND